MYVNVFFVSLFPIIKNSQETDGKRDFILLNLLLLRVLARLARQICSPVAFANSAVWVKSLVVPGSGQNECLKVSEFGQVCKMCSDDWGPCPHWQMGVSSFSIT
ncbi:hypothetical protein PoB_004019000 [Plakobranchus ocellatus]|uniref:Secreted protein n=1 Tax=Plakobranchus ocellatus TaxID=259542 RepID=A0AAV4B268_9GAST|nr:hypothetical protein PoB_004019000 [Plakobranchus ocellatus]